MPERTALLTDWLQQLQPNRAFDLTPASSDASFRRYFRVTDAHGSQIAMDAPPEKEELGPFIAIAALLGRLGLHVPTVIEQQLQQGFLLLKDLGETPYLDALNQQTVESLYGAALDALLTLQRAPTVASTLPHYDAALLMREMALFHDWFLQCHLGVELNQSEEQQWSAVCELLIESALQQPQVMVHRDYHSRNLMVTEPNPGIIDFQDAVVGPITYDLVSLLRDCYISWPPQQVALWVDDYHQRLKAHGIASSVETRQFMQWFDWMGVQRHLKAIGIFARLHIRDGKPGYLADIPRTLNYIIEVTQQYPPLAGLAQLIQDRVVPQIQRQDRGKQQ